MIRLLVVALLMLSGCSERDPFKDFVKAPMWHVQLDFQLGKEVCYDLGFEDSASGLVVICIQAPGNGTTFLAEHVESIENGDGLWYCPGDRWCPKGTRLSRQAPN